jgi:NADH:ubiquinone oxidoreductase subunit E
MCTNLSCQLRGALDVLGAFAEATGAPVKGSSPDGQFQLRPFECLGACDLAPMASIEGHYRGPLTPEDAFRIAAELRAGTSPADLLPEKMLPEARGQGA